MSRRLSPIDVTVLLFLGLVAAAVLLPGCERGHSASRRAQCFNSQKQLCLALQWFEGAHKHFPGYKQELAGRDVGWPVILLPHLDRVDLWKTWKEGRQGKKLLRLMICPSDWPPNPGPEDGPCSYTVNTKICMDGKGLSLDYINSHDGGATTLLVGENLRIDKAHEWWDTDPARVGFTVGPMADNIRSNHRGGAIVGYCDGHVSFLRNDIGEDLYSALVTPDGGEEVDESKL
jgi:prepilin-type processing-associated H-X9-DG protein